jgi:hypothetical protein
MIAIISSIILITTGGRRFHLQLCFVCNGSRTRFFGNISHLFFMALLIFGSISQEFVELYLMLMIPSNLYFWLFATYRVCCCCIFFIAYFCQRTNSPVYASSRMLSVETQNVAYHLHVQYDYQIESHA